MTKASGEKDNTRNGWRKPLLNRKMRYSRGEVGSCRSTAEYETLRQVNIEKPPALRGRDLGGRNEVSIIRVEMLDSKQHTYPFHNIMAVLKADRKLVFRGKSVLNAQHKSVNLVGDSTAREVIRLEATKNVSSTMHVNNQRQGVVFVRRFSIRPHSYLCFISNFNVELLDLKACLGLNR